MTSQIEHKPAARSAALPPGVSLTLLGLACAAHAQFYAVTDLGTLTRAALSTRGAQSTFLSVIDFAAAAGLNSCQFYVTIPSPRTLLHKEWQAATGYEGDYFSTFTENPDTFNLGSIIASDMFSKEEIDTFLELGFSKTRHFYNLKEETHVQVE